jgi:hypothetical protein
MVLGYIWQEKPTSPWERSAVVVAHEASQVIQGLDFSLTSKEEWDEVQAKLATWIQNPSQGLTLTGMAFNLFVFH